MTYLTFIITIPLALFALTFAASNSATVKAGLWPLEQTWEMPLSILGLGLLGLGFFCGALFVWILYQRLRYRHWQTRRRAERLEKELDNLHQKAEDEAKAAAQKNLPAPPALPAK